MCYGSAVLNTCYSALTIYQHIAGIYNRNERKKKSTSKQDNVYRLEPNMKQVSDWFMENIPIGNLESSIFSNVSHAQEHAAKIEQLWLNPAIQATYKRKSELYLLPDVANYFLDRVCSCFKLPFKR